MCMSAFYWSRIGKVFYANTRDDAKKINFDTEAIKGNLIAVLSDLKKAKPAAAKGVYLKKLTLSSTMGPGLNIDQASLEVQ